MQAAYSRVYYESMFCPNLRSIRNASYLQPWTRKRYNDIDGNRYFLTYLGMFYTTNRRPGYATLPNPINSPAGPNNPPGWGLVTNPNYGVLDGPAGRMVEVRASGHVLGWGGLEMFTKPSGGSKNTGLTEAAPDCGNHLYNDGHAKWVGVSEIKAKGSVNGSDVFYVMMWRHY